MSEIKIQVAESIQKECKKRNMTLSRMASLSGVSKSTLHDWATIGTYPKLDKTGVKNLKKLADFLEISVAQLVFGNLNENKAQVLFESTFRDGDHKYKLKIERISDS
jgi:transcriptional regulator with XRE-family HTH domain